MRWAPSTASQSMAPRAGSASTALTLALTLAIDLALTRNPNPNQVRLNSTVSLASAPGVTSADFLLAWSCVDNSGATLDLADALVTTTGANQPNLAVRANVLQAGNEYTFKLTATYPGQNPGESSLLPYELATFIP